MYMCVRVHALWTCICGQVSILPIIIHVHVHVYIVQHVHVLNYLFSYNCYYYYYCREGHYEATELLLDHCANLNIPSGSNDDTPLTLACWKGHDDVVCLLLERQSCINHQTKTGCTPLMEATR